MQRENCRCMGLLRPQGRRLISGVSATPQILSIINRCTLRCIIFQMYAHGSVRISITGRSLRLYRIYKLSRQPAGFMAAAEDAETLGSETKDILLLTSCARSLSPKSYGADKRRARLHLQCSGLSCRKEILRLGNLDHCSGLQTNLPLASKGDIISTLQE